MRMAQSHREERTFDKLAWARYCCRYPMGSKVDISGAEARCEKRSLQHRGGVSGRLKSLAFILIELLVIAIMAGMMLISCFKLN
jgi:hypothetical protein